MNGEDKDPFAGLTFEEPKKQTDPFAGLSFEETETPTVTLSESELTETEPKPKKDTSGLDDFIKRQQSAKGLYPEAPIQPKEQKPKQEKTAKQLAIETLPLGQRLGNLVVQGLAPAISESARSIAVLAKNMNLFGEYDDKKVEDLATYKFADWVNKTVEDYFPADQELQNTLAGKLVQGGGSLASFAGAGMAGKALKGMAWNVGQYTAPAVLGAFQNGGMEYKTAYDKVSDANNLAQEYFVEKYARSDEDIPKVLELQEKLKGRDANETAFNTFIGASLIGTTEALPVASWMKKIDGVTGGLLNKAIIKYIPKVSTGGQVAMQGIEEGAQEAVSQFLTNANANAIYDNTRKLYEGVAESGQVGGILGATLQILTAGLTKRAKTARTPEDKTAINASLNYVQEKQEELKDVQANEIIKPEASKEVQELISQKTAIETDLAQGELSDGIEQKLKSKVADIDTKIQSQKEKEIKEQGVIEVEKQRIRDVENEIAVIEKKLTENISEPTREALTESLEELKTLQSIKSENEKSEVVLDAEGQREKEEVLKTSETETKVSKAVTSEPLTTIKQLGTGANVYFETDKYRVNDSTIKGAVILNIKSTTSGEYPALNAVFRTADEAVKVAEILEKEFPEGVPPEYATQKYIETIRKEGNIHEQMRAKNEANKIAQNNNFKEATHLRNAVAKVTGKKPETVQEITLGDLNKVNESKKLISLQDERSATLTTKEKGDSEISQTNTGQKAKVRRRGTPKHKRRIKNPRYLEALKTESESLYDKALQFFIGGGKVTREGIQSILGGGGKKITKELQSRIGILSKDGMSVNDIAHHLWEQRPEGDERFDTQDYRNAVEEVLTQHNGTRTMVDSLLESNKIKTEEDYYSVEYPDYDYDIISEAEDIYDNLTEKQKEDIANDLSSDEYNQMLVDSYYDGEGLSETEQANRRKAEKEFTEELEKTDSDLLNAKKERQNKVNSLNKKVDLFGGTGKKDGLFDEAQDQSPEQISKILKPFDDAISKLEKQKQEFESSKEKYISEKYKGQADLTELDQAKADLKKAWNALGNQGAFYNPKAEAQKQRDFDRALLNFAKVALKKFGNDVSKAIKHFVEQLKSIDVALSDDDTKQVFKDLGATVPTETGGLKHADTAKKKEAMGMEEYKGGYELSPEQAMAAADTWIADGGNVYEVVKKLLEGGDLSLTESAIAGKYIQALDARISKTPTPELLEELAQIIKAADKMGTAKSESMFGRKLMFPKQDNLSNFLYDRSIDKGRSLTEEEIAEEKSEYEKLKQLNEEYKAELQAEKEKYNKLVAEKGINRANAEMKKAAKKSKEYYEKEKTDAVTAAREALKKLRTGQSGFLSSAPLVAEMVAVAPHIKKYVKALVGQNVSKLDDIVNQVYADFKDIVGGLRHSDVIDVIAGEYNEKKSTKNEKMNQLHLIRREAELLRKLADVRKGLNSSKESIRNEASARILELEKKIKEVQKLNKSREMQMDWDNVRNKTPEGRAKAREVFLEQKLKQLQDDLKTGNWAKEPEKQKKLPLSRKALDLRDEVIKLEKIIKLKRHNDRQARMVGSKALEVGKKALATTRVMQTIFDWSVTFRQLAKITMNPMQYKTTGKIIGAQAGSTFSEKNFDVLMDAIHKDDLYHDMVSDGVVFNDLNTGTTKTTNEEYKRSYAHDIPVIGAIIRASNRAADAALNTARVELYKQKYDSLVKQGYTRESDPELFKKMGGWVMNMTGRGTVMKALEQPQFQEIMGNTLYGQRLMASHINTLNPMSYVDLKFVGENIKATFNNDDFKKYDPVKKEAIKDLVGYAIGVTVLGAVLKGLGAAISGDDDDSDFMQVRFGEKVYDITGGDAAYIRTALRLIKSVVMGVNSFAGGKVTKDEATRQANFAKDSFQRFLRNKLAPNTANFYNVTFGGGENTLGEEAKWTDFVEAYPMYFDDVYKELQDEGISALATVALPNVIGVGYGSYANRANKDFSKDIEKVTQEIKESDDPAERYRLNKKLKTLEGKEEKQKSVTNYDKKVAERQIKTLDTEIKRLKERLENAGSKKRQDELYESIMEKESEKKDYERVLK